MASQVEDIKWLPSASDRRFLVDGFAFKSTACSTYFLTHFHSDHTVGLNKNFSFGLVYTSEVTARLLVHDMGLPPSCVVALPMHTPTVLHGCRVTLLDANHCPGAVMLLVEVLTDRAGGALPTPEVILHTGDCRWEGWMASQIPAGLQVNTLFLDTTYAVPRYAFPPQAAVLDALVEEVAGLLAAQPATLLVVAAYHIGKEKVYLGLAKRLGLKVWCSAAKRRVLGLLGLPSEDMALLTDCPEQAGLHVSGWGMRPEQLHARFLQAAAQANVPGAAAPATALLASAAGGVKPEPAAGGVKPEPATGAAAEAAVGFGAGLDGMVPEPGDDVAPDGALYEGAEEELDAAAACKGTWQHVIGIRATGWSFRKKGKLVSRWVVGPVTVLGAPYSEHSSWLELCDCVRTLRPSRLVPTVNAGTPAASRALVERFVGFMDLSRQRGRMDMYLTRAPGRVDGTDAVDCGMQAGRRPAPGATIDLCDSDGDAAVGAAATATAVTHAAAGRREGAGCGAGSDAEDERHLSVIDAFDDPPCTCHARPVPEPDPDPCGPGPGASNEPGVAANPGEARTHPPDAFDVAGVDLSEQQRIWEQIQAGRSVSDTAALTPAERAGKRARGPVGSTSSRGPGRRKRSTAAVAATQAAGTAAEPVDSAEADASDSARGQGTVNQASQPHSTSQRSIRSFFSVANMSNKPPGS